MGIPKKITVDAVDYDGRAEGDFANIRCDEPATYYKDQAHAGLMSVHGVYDEGERVGTVGLRMDNLRDGTKQAVIVAGAGKGFKLTERGIPHINELARQRGAKTVRLHTERPGLLRKLAQILRGREVVVIWEV